MKTASLAAALLAAGLASAADNPFIPGYVGDPHMTRDPDTGMFLVYGTTDGYGKGDDLAGGPFCVRESMDLVSWTTRCFSQEDGTFVKPANSLWAPAAVKGEDGRWYLYYIARGGNCYVASSGTPHGPWRDELDGKPLAPGMFDTDVVRIDGRVFVVTMNGSKEAWGVYIGELEQDMVTWKRPLARAYRGPDLFEGPGLFKRGDMWYLTYSNGSLAGSYHVNYATSSSPFGPYTADTKNNPVMSPDYGSGVICTGHNNVWRIGDDFYMCYHRKSSPGSVRQAALQKLEFRADGSIVPMKPAAAFERPAALPPASAEADLARGKLAVASSEAAGSKCDVAAACRASNAVDGSYGTIWKAASTGAEWLKVDLGTVCGVREASIHFEFDGVAYRYLLESSVDGRSWTEFADRRADASKTNPRVDSGSAKARYLRWSFEGGVNVNCMETVGVFEVRVHGEPGPDLALASFTVNGAAPHGFAPERTRFTAWVPDADSAEVAAAARDRSAQVTVETARGGKLPCDAVVTVRSCGLVNRYVAHLKRLGRSVKGKPFGAEPESDRNAASAAFDGDAGTWYESFDVDDGYAGIDVGEGLCAEVSAVRFTPRAGNLRAMVGGVFEGSGDGSAWTVLHRVESEPDRGENCAEVKAGRPFRLLRYRGPKASSACVAEIAFFGEVRKASGRQALAVELSPKAKRSGDAVVASGARLVNDWSFEGGGKGWSSPWPVRPEKANAFEGAWAVNANSSGRLAQTLAGLADGTYEFSLQVQGDGKAPADALDLFAEGADGEKRVAVSVSGWRRWNRFTVGGIRVRGGKMTVGLSMKRTGNSGLWAWADCAELVRIGD